MSIQRYGPRGGDILTAQSTGQYVTYADHLAEKAEWERYTTRCEYKATEAEQQRIVEAVKTLALYPIGSWESENEAVVLSEVLAAIKGESA